METAMPDDSSGNHSLQTGYLAVTGQAIQASQHNPPLEDLSSSMSRRYMRDGRTPMLGNVPMNGYRATGAADAEDGQDYVTLAQVQAMVLGLGFYPGFMAPYTIHSTTVPVGWLLANGQSVSRATYAALWAAVSGGNNLAATQGAKTDGQYGPGNGATTFTLPNLYADGGLFIRPLTTGRTIGSKQSDALGSHTHTGTALSAGNHEHDYTDTRVGSSGGGVQQGTGREITETQDKETDSAGSHTHTLDINSTGGTETRPINVAYPVLIKV
jgi:hypothetical protein